MIVLPGRKKPGRGRGCHKRANGGGGGEEQSGQDASSSVVTKQPPAVPASCCLGNSEWRGFGYCLSVSTLIL